MYGIDWDGPLPLDENDSVCVLSTTLPLSDSDVEQLTSLVNPLAFSDNFGVNLYLKCLQFIASRLC